MVCQPLHRSHGTAPALGFRVATSFLHCSLVFLQTTRTSLSLVQILGLMRLLHTASDGRFEWSKNYISNVEIPNYAILSHTWTDEEVTFDDLNNINNGKGLDSQNSEGYRKLRFCAEQAKRDGLVYFWVDTCCINKSDSSELQEAINSMFRWYQRAARCYVYLSDVEHDTLDEEGELAFKQSRWHTRGWTLQELLAPKSVEFFSKTGRRLGDKESLRHIIHGITGIPVDALHGGQISEFTVSERFSWTENRQTTREEDAAYCLLGIFGIYMPLIYGEGKDNATRRLKKVVHEASQDVTGDFVDSTQSGRQSQKERLRKICNWLSAPDPSANYHKAHKQRQAGTGIWLVEGEQFTRWKASAASRLWLHGIPGCGKTILSSTIIENMLHHCGDDPSMVTAYFYFDFKDTQKQGPELAIRSLLSQLLQRAVITPKSIDALFASCENTGRLPPLHEFLEAVRSTLQEFGQVYIIIDALDECKQRSELMDMLETVAGWQPNNLHLLLTSRKERDIESSLEKIVTEEDTICLQRDEVDKDIQRYIQQRLSDDKGLAKWNKDAAVRQEIEAAMMSGARGMFRWAVCQLDRLGKCRNRMMLRKSLATLPQTLDQTYEYILSDISEEDSDYAMRILQWLTFSERPLSIEEIAEVVALDAARDPAFDRDEVLEDPLEVLNICSSLVTVTVVEETSPGRSARVMRKRIAALAHYSVQEYLVSDRIKQGPAKRYGMEKVECQTSITKGCLKYLAQLQQPLSWETLPASALAIYVARFWGHHLRKTEEEMKEVSRLAMELLSMERPAYLTWIQLSDPDWPGLSTITKTLLDQGVDINAQGGAFGNALQAASLEGHEDVVRILLDDKTTDVNTQGGYYGNALQAASLEGHEKVVQMLLTSADVNAQGGDFGNALQAASLRGHERIVKLLLDKNANINAQGGYYGNALQAAASSGHAQVVKMMLNDA
ncbi:HET-domain-containing protein, partial [Karstenula rhodostoma CBS 690.94]